MKHTTSDRSTRAILASTGSTRRGDAFDRGGGARYREKSLVLEAAMDEYLRLQQEGASITASEFCERYPDYRHSLKRLIDVEQVFSSLGDLPADNWPEIGARFLDYEILALLGAGSIARVFLAAELQLGGRPVAIKVSPHGGYEAETLGKLRHPNIVEVYSVHHESETGLTAVCMPYRGSATLSDVLDEVYRDHKPASRAEVILDVARGMALLEAGSEDERRQTAPDSILVRGSFTDGVVSLGIQLASALAYSHDHGVMHRDLKPSNVLLTPSGRPMLLDFNLSYDEALNMVHRGGTLPYSAPEQLLEACSEATPGHSAVDDRADIFSLGAILYELLTGQLPYGAPPSNIGPRQAIRFQLNAHQSPPTSIRKLNPQVDHELERIIFRCLEVEPEKRFASMFELESALRGHFRRSAVFRRWLGRNRPKVALTTVGIFGLGIALAVALAMRLPPHERAYLAAQSALAAKDYRTAIDQLDMALGYEPSHSPSLFLLGVTLQHVGDHKVARDVFAKAEPYLDTSSYWEHRAYSEYQLKNYEGAYLFYVQASRRNPSSVSLQLRRAYTWFASREDMAALKSVNEFIQSNPEMYEGYLLRALIVYRSTANRDLPLDSAIADVLKACEMTPNSLTIEYEAAKMLAAASHQRPELVDDLKRHLQRAVELGCGRHLISISWEFKSWQGEEWFDQILEQADSNSTRAAPSLADIYIRPPALLASMNVLP